MFSRLKGERGKKRTLQDGGCLVCRQRPHSDMRLWVSGTVLNRGRGTQAGAPSSQGTGGWPTNPPTEGKLEEVEEGTSSSAEGETG